MEVRFWHVRNYNKMLILVEISLLLNVIVLYTSKLIYKRKLIEAKLSPDKVLISY